MPIVARVYQSNLALRQAAREGSLFHLWFHPFNLATDPNALLEGLESIFQEVARLRDLGILTNATMGDMSESLAATAPQRRATA